MNEFNERGGPVCVFDSGIGGLNLLAECAALCPDRDFIYFADNDNVPYGNMARARMRELVLGIFDEIASCNPSAAVVACNTVTAAFIRDLRAAYPFPIVGIQPAVKQAAEIKGRCLVLATRATASSSVFIELCSRWLGDRACVVPCPDLAHLIEENIFSLPQKEIVSMLPDCNPSCVVLGCTHYVFVRDYISTRYNCPVFDGIVGTANHLRLLLGKNSQISAKKQKITFLRGNIDKNKQIYNLILKKYHN